jgi:3-oxosteroid 1-dehydrogenase
VLTGHCVRSLLTEAAPGGERVVGVWATTPEGAVELRAERGVLLGSGGFERNAERRREHGVPGEALWSMAPAGTNLGEPIAAALAAGAAADWSGHGWFCPGLEQPDGGGSFTVGFRGGIMLDRAGRRYGNECLPYDQFGRLMAEAPERVPSWFVFDAREGGRLPAIAMPEGDAEAHLAAGTWVRADTLADLAPLIGLDPAHLEAEVARFNGHCAAGHDPQFGRGEDEYDTFFAWGEGPGPNRALVPLEIGPFTAARFVLSDLGTKGGVAIDARGRALRPDGSALPGLYACGNAAASLFGPYYPGPGAPLGSAMVTAALAVGDLRG